MEEALRVFSGKIFVFDEGQKWFISDFIEFQYGDLNPQNRAHNSVIAKLLKYGITKNKPLISPLQGAKDKEQDKDKDKVKDKGRSFRGKILFDEKLQLEYQEYFDGIRYGNQSERNSGGMGDEAIKKHCEKLGIVYEPVQ